MTKETASQYLPLVQALSDEKTIQYRWHPDERWSDTNTLDCEQPVERFRVKPEPREFWMVIREDGGIWTYQKEPDECMGEIIHVREVLP